MRVLLKLLTSFFISLRSYEQCAIPRNAASTLHLFLNSSCLNAPACNDATYTLGMEFWELRVKHVRSRRRINYARLTCKRRTSTGDSVTSRTSAHNMNLSTYRADCGTPSQGVFMTVKYKTQQTHRQSGLRFGGSNSSYHYFHGLPYK